MTIYVMSELTQSSAIRMLHTRTKSTEEGNRWCVLSGLTLATVRKDILKRMPRDIHGRTQCLESVNCKSTFCCTLRDN